MHHSDNTSTHRIIIHIDLDYFFAQCEEIKRPEIKDKPVVVCIYSGRTKESGVVSTCNYIARNYGIKSGIPIKIAKAKLAQVSQAVFLPSDIKYYSEKSDTVMTLIHDFLDNYSLSSARSNVFQPIKCAKFEYIGLDECFVEVTEKADFDFAKAKELANNLKKQIRKETRLTCSIGIAPNKMIAKIASDFQKPDGMTIVEPDEAKNFISNCNVDKIPGIGPKTSAKLLEMGIRTGGELSAFGLFRLIDAFGKKYATYLYNSAQGIDNQPVKSRGLAKQIGRIITLKKDISQTSEIEGELEYICKSVYKTALDQNVLFRNIGILLILNDLDNISRSKSLKTHSRDFNELYSSVKSILNVTLNNCPNIKVRRLGIKLSDLKDNEGQNTMLNFINNNNNVIDTKTK
ncbi:MAG TPA: DNA polymerase IV [Nitrososphaeraceae archaeon]|nr:DNA polymerase IV [Nitrososphaeraceae archaeon]